MRLPSAEPGSRNAPDFCDDQPFYGLQPPGFDGLGEPLRRIEDLAAYFAAQIRAFRPEGPYILAGFCAGGLTAFELGLQLASAGAEISFLALFGAPYSARYRRLPRLRELLAEQVERVAKHARTLRSLSSVERREYIAAKLRVREARHTAQRLAASDPVLVLRGKVGRATLAAARCYTPRHSASRVCLFMPSRDWVRSRNEPLRWLSVAPHAEVYYGPDGCDGEAMLYEQYAPAFAELFRRSRERKA